MMHDVRNAAAVRREHGRSGRRAVASFRPWACRDPIWTRFMRRTRSRVRNILTLRVHINDDGPVCYTTDIYRQYYRQQRAPPSDKNTYVFLSESATQPSRR
jgi:hypothetical protein